MKLLFQLNEYTVKKNGSPVVRGCKFIAMSPKLMVPGVRFRTLLPEAVEAPSGRVNHLSVVVVLLLAGTGF